MAALLGSAAQAAPIAAGSIISFSDGANYNSTSITFLNGGAENVTPNTAGGSFAPAFSAGCVGCAAFTNFTFAPFAGPVQVYTATLGGSTTTFTLNSVSTSSSQAGFLDLLGSGTVTLTGYDPTPGTFYLSTQGPQNTNVSFSVTSTANPASVPEPAGLALLALPAGLLGMLLVKRPRRAA